MHCMGQQALMSYRVFLLLLDPYFRCRKQLAARSSVQLLDRSHLSTTSVLLFFRMQKVCRSTFCQRAPPYRGLIVPNQQGVAEDIVLGFDDASQYQVRFWKLLPHDSRIATSQNTTKRHQSLCPV